MADLWCTECRSRCAEPVYGFFGERCEVCNARLVEEETIGDYEVDFKDVDISYKFNDDDADDRDDGDDDDDSADGEDL